MISNGLWRRLGSDAAIVGKLLTLDGRSYTVAGVMPPAFRFPVNDVGPTGGRPDVAAAGRRGGCQYFVYARRKPGVTFAAAQDDLRRVAARSRPRQPRIASLPPPWGSASDHYPRHSAHAPAAARGRRAAVPDHLCQRRASC